MFESNKVSLNPSFILLPNNIYTEQFWVRKGSNTFYDTEKHWRLFKPPPRFYLVFLNSIQ